MDSFGVGFYCLLISLFWGGTNPLIKKSTKDITKIKSNSWIITFINEIKYLVVNWRYVLLFLTNQIGSVLYFLLLQSVDLSFIVPVVNALTFVMTGCVGILIGEKPPNLRTLFGVLLIIIGITLCVIDKASRT